MNRSTILSRLEQIGVQPSRSLGQNFLHDHNTAEWMVSQLNLKPNELWVELGPGLGSLTEFAILRSENGLLIEKDERMVAFLRPQYPTLEIVHGDALEFDMRTLQGRGPVKVLGNLPYNVSSQILFQFTEESSPATILVFTLQKDLGERLCAAPRSKAYGAMTLLIGRRWRVKYLRSLPGSVFHPAPNVESAVVMVTPRPAAELPDCDAQLFRRLVKMGFSQRRKLLRNNLSDQNLDWPALCAHLGVAETTRAEELSLEQWIALTNFAAASK
jgi:16S rRNA (adenine1518-N6/adenine1519-N6)-dimethyltransferase